MFCKNCGKMIDNNAYVCPHCGVKVTVDEPKQETTNVFAGLSYLGILIPLLGWIFGGIGLSKAQKTGTGAGLSIGGLIVSTVMFFIYFAAL